MKERNDDAGATNAQAPSVYGDDGVTIIGMIGVVRESTANRGATLSVFGGGINPGAETPSGVDPDYILDFARSRGRGIRHGPHRLLLLDAGRVRGGGLRRRAY